MEDRRNILAYSVNLRHKFLHKRGREAINRLQGDGRDVDEVKSRRGDGNTGGSGSVGRGIEQRADTHGRLPPGRHGGTGKESWESEKRAPSPGTLVGASERTITPKVGNADICRKAGKSDCSDCYSVQGGTKAIPH